MERAPYKYSPRANDIVELGNLIVLEYELQEKILRETESSSNKKGSKWLKVDMLCLFRSSWQLVQIVAKYKLCDDDEVSLVLKKLVRKDPHLHKRNTVLHEAVVNYGWLSGPETVRILVKAGMNVNAVDHNNGDTPLHIAVTSRPWRDEIHCLMDILQLLFDGGAHHDFVNNNGKTPMDLAATDEARMILLERRNLELQCISAKAVKKFGIPYLGVVPKVLEKYINLK